MSLREYIVTANSFDDLDSIYQDMETPGGGLYIPHRAVEVSKRRSISRNTHYMLTDDEAQLVSNDTRVLSVELNYEDSGIVINPFSFATVQTSTQWNKSTTLTRGDVNWGLLRSIEGTNRANWGVDATAQVSGPINMTSLGRDVDVIIADGIMPLGHPEWDSIDDPNVSRYIRHDWYQYNNVLGITDLTGSYPYTTFEASVAYDGNNDHGTHVASTACGYQQGWAKCANIYNIFPYFSAQTYYLLDWIRAFHLLKSVNSNTGRKNPTVVNMSYGSQRIVVFQDITEINFQGTTYFKPTTGWTEIDKGRFGLAWAPGTNKASVICMVRSTAMDVDLEEARQQGIVLVCAAGNDNTHSDVEGGVNYNNNIKSSTDTITYYHRGSSQSGISNISDGVICVGAADATVLQRKASFSNTGPRIDIFAPGVSIMGAHRTPKDDMATWLTNPQIVGMNLSSGTYTLGSGSSIISNSNKGVLGNQPDPIPSYPNGSKFGTLGYPDGFFANRFIIKNAKVVVSSYYTHCYLDVCNSIDGGWGGEGQKADRLEDIVVQYSTDNTTWNEFARVKAPDVGLNVWTSVLQSQGLPSGIYTAGGVYIRYTQPFQNNIPQGAGADKWAVGNLYFVKISKITDTRDENYYVNKLNGTSMASPQVAGLLACAAEVLGHMDQTDAHKIINKNSSSNILYTEPWNGGIYPSTSFTSPYGLQGANNLYLKHRYERNLSGAIHPKMDYNDQDYNTSPDKIMYPRPRIRRKG